jgi:hypothetical protein
VLERIRNVGWIDKNNKLTENAYHELQFLRNQTKDAVLKYELDDTFYFPGNLRAPVEKFS